MEVGLSISHRHGRSLSMKIQIPTPQVRLWSRAQRVDGVDHFEVAAVAVFFPQSTGLHGALEVPVGDVLGIGQHVVPRDHPCAHGVSEQAQSAVHHRILTRHRPATGDEFPQEIIQVDQRGHIVFSNGRAVLENDGRHAQKD